MLYYITLYYIIIYYIALLYVICFCGYVSKIYLNISKQPKYVFLKKIYDPNRANEQ